MDITDIYRTTNPNTKEYTLFFVPNRTFSKTEHIICHKASLKGYKKTEIMLYILSDHHGTQMDFYNNRNTRKLAQS